MDGLPKGLITGRTAKLPGDWKEQSKAATHKGSNLEDGFLRLWLSMFPNLPQPEREYRFAPPRRWRFDFAWPASMVAVELEGMTRAGGRHQRWGGFQKDAEKYNAATKRGWRVLRYTSQDMRERPVQNVTEAANLVERLHGCETGSGDGRED